MSVKKEISTYVSTGRGFSPPGNFLHNVAGGFLTKKDFTVTQAQLEDPNYFFEAFENLDIIPLHLAQSLVINDEETVKQTSLQDYDYELRPGKYKHTMRFDWALAFHQIVETYSGSDLNIIEYTSNNKLILAEESEGVYRGIKTDSLVLQKPKVFTNGTEPAYSDLDIELRSGEVLAIFDLDWEIESVDKLFMSINIEYIDSNTLNFSATYDGKPVNDADIKQSDISIEDSTNGDLEPDFYSYSGGVFQLKNFEAPLTIGMMQIVSTLFLGCVRYINRVTAVPTTTNNDFEDAVNYDFQDSVNYDFET